MRLPTTTAKTLLLVRHGITEMNVYLSRCAYGSRGFIDPGLWDTRLTAEGEAQARRLAPRLRSAHAREPISLLVASPLSRALSTATYAFAELPEDVPTIVSPKFAERGYLSSDRGRAPAELASEYPRFATALSALPERWWWEGDEAMCAGAP